MSTEKTDLTFKGSTINIVSCLELNLSRKENLLPNNENF